MPQNPLTDINQDFEIREAKRLALELGKGYVQIEKFPINPDVLRETTKEQVLLAQAIPFERNRKNIQLAVVHPDNPETQNFIKNIQEKYKTVDTKICTHTGLLEATKLFDLHLLNKETIQVQRQFQESDEVKLSENLSHFEDLEKSITSLPTAQAINQIQIAALKSRASDIHIQPEYEYVQLRFRIDGILHPVAKISLDIAKQIILRIKYQSGMRANVDNIPQDGHLSLEVNNRSIEFRISVLPTESVESVVMRILDSEKNIKKFSELGFAPDLEKRLKTMMGTKNGLILLTGPTGSGKTTTLYAMLSHLNTPEKKIVTLEDPIEYHLEGITQSQVSGDYTFASGLRALLRHDPDVVLVGEIRDLETAAMASEASLTGHVVFSSLHSNTAVGAITRLKNLHLESYNMASSLRGIISQRLIRKICPHCTQADRIYLSNGDRIAQAIEKIEKYNNKKIPRHKEVLKDGTEKVFITLQKPQGCEACSQTGFIGQQVLSECLLVDDAIRTQIASGASEREILSQMEKNGDFFSLFEDGVRLALEEKTSLSEVFRVAGGL
jgi:general secretion pathway protein E